VKASPKVIVNYKGKPAANGKSDVPAPVKTAKPAKPAKAKASAASLSKKKGKALARSR
jgi:hypothetical protein